MKVATYSYDWIFGRRAPRTLVAGLDELAIGQTLMGSFDLVDFESPRRLTLRLIEDAPEARFVRDVAVTYLIVPQSSGVCRLLQKAAVRHRRGALGFLTRAIVPWGDLIMTRRQFLNFKGLSKQTVKAGQGSVPA